MTWTACWRLWGEKFAVTCDLVWKEGRLDLRDMNVLRSALSEMGSAHKACGFVVTLWAHLWVNHMRGIAREWGTLSTFSAFKGEGRHESLKNEIRKRSFKGGSAASPPLPCKKSIGSSTGVRGAPGVFSRLLSVVLGCPLLLSHG